MRDKPRPIVVEFVGLPGSGKTFLTNTLLARLRSSSVPARRPLVQRPGLPPPVRIGAKGISAASQLLLQPAQSWETVRPFLGSAHPARREVLPLVLNSLSVSGSIRRVRSSDHVLVLDQGLLQLHWSFLLRTRSPTAQRKARHGLQTLLERSRARFRIVVLHVDLPTVTTRLNRRPTLYAFDRQFRSNPSETWKRGIRALDHTLDSLAVLSSTQPDVAFTELHMKDGPEPESAVSFLLEFLTRDRRDEQP